MNETSSKLNPWMISTLVLAGIVVGYGVAQVPALKGGENVAGKKAEVQAPVAQAPVPAQSPKLTPEQITALPDDDTVFGDAEAPITMVEFSDFQCPYCAKFLLNVFPKIEENYIKTGKVKFVYRDFPLDFHEQAELAAEAAECADEQGKFRLMHDELFNQQQAWAGNAGAPELMKSYAKKIGLDEKQFGECLGSQKYAMEVRKDLVDGASLGNSGTPGFYINGKHVSGALPFDRFFKPLLDAELAGKNWVILEDQFGNAVDVRID